MLLILIISWSVAACTKRGPGYYSGTQATPIVTGNSPVTQYYYFNNVVLDSISNDTFNLPRLTQGIIDSGSVTVTFRSSIVWLNTWFTLPNYIFPDGSVVSVYKIGLQPGMAILGTKEATTPAMNYCFALSVH